MENRSRAVMGFIIIPLILVVVGLFWKFNREDKTLTDNTSTVEVEAPTLEDNNAETTLNRDVIKSVPVQSQSCKNSNKVTELNCAIKTALRQGNAIPCRQLSGSYRDACLEQLGSNTKTLSYCREIVSEPMHDSCVTLVAKQTFNSTYCAQVRDFESLDNCYTELAVLTQNTNLCNLVQLPVNRKKCLLINPAHRAALQ